MDGKTYIGNEVIAKWINGLFEPFSYLDHVNNSLLEIQMDECGGSNPKTGSDDGGDGGDDGPGRKWQIYANLTRVMGLKQ